MSASHPAQDEANARYATFQGTEAAGADMHMALLQSLDRIANLLEQWMNPPEAQEAQNMDAIAFRWAYGTGFRHQPQLLPIREPQLIGFDDLRNVEPQREIVEINTRHFVMGYPANNVLLTGARGTGKSSLVRACLEAFHAQGLRLIEVEKQHLDDLPKIADRVRHRPERFIVFCDDLSFETGETTYKGLKTVLDGSLAGSSPNLLVYATSNRRHLVTEAITDNLETRCNRDGELHPGDAVEEKISLSERFGIWVHFYAFSEEEYLAAVAQWMRHHGFDRAGIEAAREAALRWARTRGARSGRIANQFARHHAAQHALERARVSSAHP